jgi:hypothetical protein
VIGDVRLGAHNRLKSDIAPLPKSAKSQTFHLITSSARDREDRRWKIEANALGSLEINNKLEVSGLFER